MKRLGNSEHALFRTALTLTILFHLFADPVIAADTQPVERRSATRVRSVASSRLPYLAITPVGYSDRHRRWPLIVFLHGSDQSGTDLNQVKVNGPPKKALTDLDFPFVVVAPQLAPGKIWNPDLVAAFVKRMIPRYRIDSTRVYLTGLSTGGYGTWGTGLKYPERFAAIVPVAGGGDTVIPKHSQGEHLTALRSLPVWAFHGGSDSSVSPDESQRMVAELQSIGASDVRATIYPGAGHDIWNQVYDDPALYDWLLQHHR